MSSEAGHVQITEFSKEVIPMINWQMEDLFCQYGVAMPYFMLDFDFPDYSERPDWVSGYNFNLDWGPWGYWLTWFNQLLNILFDTAKIPKGQMPDLSPGSWAMFNDYMSELYDESAPGICMHVYSDAKSYYGIKGATRNGAMLRLYETENINYNDSICIDSDDNSYQVAGDGTSILKWDREGNLKLTKVTGGTRRVAIGVDGYLYELGYDNGTGTVIKRDLATLTSQATMPGVDYTLTGFEGFTLDSSGYIYVISRTDNRIEKWDFSDGSVVASRATAWGTGSSLAVIDALLVHSSWHNYCETIPTTLDEAPTQWDVTDIDYPQGVTAIDGTHFLICGYDTTDKIYKLGKYTIAKDKLWVYQAGTYDDNVYQVAAYPFA